LSANLGLRTLAGAMLVRYPPFMSCTDGTSQPGTRTSGSPDDPEVRRPSVRDQLPRGFRWRITSRLTGDSRRKRFELFMSLLTPDSTARVLDVGVTDTDWRSSNFLEAGYPWPERITAVALDPVPTFEKLFPSVRVVVADGRQLPFEGQAFDIGFSNAVVEHVGSRADQRRFIGELLRTCRQVFVATPNAAFPIDPHTLMPFVHWMPRRLRDRILILLGQGRWAGESNLNPLRAVDLVRLFPKQAAVRVVRQRVLGMTTVVIAVAPGDGSDTDRIGGRSS
jgi:Methyltransferase domain